MNRPTTNGAHGSLTTTPIAATMIALLGGIRHGGVALSQDEFKAVQRLYGFVPEGPNAKPPPPAAPQREAFRTAYDYEAAVGRYKDALKAHANWKDPQAFMQAGADVNALRHAEADGLRLLAWLARHLQTGDDPVQVLVQMAIDAGWDVDPSDVTWAQGDDDEQSEDDQ